MADAAITKLGRVGLVFKGNYDPQAYYKRLDVVTDRGNSYAAKVDHSGIATINEDVWQLLAERGKSAYEAAKALGLTDLTEEEWLHEYDSKRDDAIEAIEKKGAETLAGIPADYTALAGEVSQLSEEIDSIATIKKWNLLDSCEIKENWFGGSEGAGFEHSAYFTVMDVLVQEGTIIIAYASSGYYQSARAISFFDADGNYISGVEENASLATDGTTVPTGSVSANVTINYISGTTNKPDDCYVCLRDSARKTTVSLNEMVNIPQVRNSIGIRKPTLSFIFDDANASDGEIVGIFDGYGYKCGFAILSTIENIGDYLTYQANGYEILSHSTDGNIMNSSVTDIDSIENKFKTSKDVLTAKGFDIRGWVTPSTDLNPDAFPALCRYYEYGFGHLHTAGNASNYVHTLFGTDVRQLDRYSLEGSTLDEAKAFIDNVIAQGGYGCFYAHALSESGNFTRENLIEILNHIKAKTDADELVVDIPRNAIYNYYMIRQYDRDLTKAPAIECEASGSMVSISDAAAQPAVQLISHIEPVQEGEGDPSPENVRPISGWSKVQVKNDTSGQTLTADLLETVYGGALDWGTGVLTVDKLCLSYDGTEGWQMKTNSSDERSVFAIGSGIDKRMSAIKKETAYDNYQFISSHFNRVRYYEPNKPDYSAYMVDSSLGRSIYLINSAWTTLEDCTNYLAEQAAAGTPLMCVFDLGNPYTIQLTPQQMDMLKGTNNVWSDCGDTSLVYVADTKLYIDGKFAELQNAILSQGLSETAE